MGTSTATASGLKAVQGARVNVCTAIALQVSRGVAVGAVAGWGAGVGRVSSMVAWGRVGDGH